MSARVESVLLVCTGNLCRSPMAEVMLRSALGDAPVDVESAGLRTEGLPSPQHAIDAMAARGLDLAGHRSRLVTVELVSSADLVLGMEPRHVRETVVLADESWPRTFTLRELVRRAEAAGQRDEEQRLSSYLPALGAGRSRLDLLDDDTDALRDPYGGSAADYERTARSLDELLGHLVALLWPSHRSQLDIS